MSAVKNNEKKGEFFSCVLISTGDLFHCGGIRKAAKLLETEKAGTHMGSGFFVFYLPNPQGVQLNAG